MKELVELEEEILAYKGRDSPESFSQGQGGWFFLTRYLAQLLGVAGRRDQKEKDFSRENAGMVRGARERSRRCILLFDL